MEIKLSYGIANLSKLMTKSQKDILLSIGTIGVGIVIAMFLFALLTGAKFAKLGFILMLCALTCITLGLSESNQQLLKQKINSL